MGEFMTGVFNTSTVVGLSIAAAGILLKISSKRYSAKCRKRIWIFMAFCLLIPFHLFRFPGAYTAEIPNVVLQEFDTQGANGTGVLPDGWHPVQGQSMQSQPVQNPSFQSAGQGAFKTELTAADVAFVLWACVAVLAAAYFAAGYWRMRSKIRRWSSECVNGHMQEIIAETANECKLKKMPRVRIMKDSMEGPFTTGVLKNIIVLPDDALHEKDLRFILKHEMIHCRNNDIFWRLFFLIVNIIHWFNPLVWYLRRAAEQDMEIACDEEVVSRASKEDRREYGDVIMSWVEKSSYTGSAVSTGYVDGVKFLKRRFDSIFNGGKKKNGILLAGGVCVLALVIGCVIQLQSGGKVYAKKKIAIDYGYEVRTDVNGDGEADRVHVSDNNLAGEDSVETSVSVSLSNGGSAWISYPDYWMSYLVTGDLSGNGAADIVLVKIAWGSVHNAGEVKVLHVQTDESGKPQLVEYPSNFIQNPDLELKWAGWEDFTGDYVWVDTKQPVSFDRDDHLGATIIEKDGKTMLRLILLAEPQTDSVKCVDCTYTADGWYIEDMLMYGDVDWEKTLLGRTTAENGGEDDNIPMDGPIGMWANTSPDDSVNVPANASGNSTGNISMKDFWKIEETGDSGTVKFATGLEIIFPEEWQGKTVLCSADELGGTDIVAICEKGNAEAGIGGDLFSLYFFEYTENMVAVYDLAKVLGLYRLGGKEYVLVQDVPGDRLYSEDDQELIDAYLSLSETLGDVVIKTDNMPGFTRCGIEDLEWVQYEGDLWKHEDTAIS